MEAPAAPSADVTDGHGRCQQLLAASANVRPDEPLERPKHCPRVPIRSREREAIDKRVGRLLQLAELLEADVVVEHDPPHIRPKVIRWDEPRPPLPRRSRFEISFLALMQPLWSKPRALSGEPSTPPAAVASLPSRSPRQYADGQQIRGHVDRRVVVWLAESDLHRPARPGAGVSVRVLAQRLDLRRGGHRHRRGAGCRL